MKAFRPLLMLVVVEAALTSCKPVRPEKSFAAEAGKACNISAERVCIFGLPRNETSNYSVALYGVEGERRNRDLRCLSNWASSKRFFLQTAPVVPCKTVEELDIADDGASACGVPAWGMRVERHPESWWRVRTTIRYDLASTNRKGGECLKQWAGKHGYEFQWKLILD